MTDITAPAVTLARRLPRAAPAAWPTRRALQIALGLVWLLDAALQFQPSMFSNRFATTIIAPATAGNPAPIAAPITWAAHLMAQHSVPANTAFALIQLTIAAGLFYRPTVKPALAASIAWAGAVWWLGEGLGGILAGASPLAGLPGAVILYALIALLLWPTTDNPATAPPAPALRGPLGQRVPRLIWLTLWAEFAWYLLLPANRAPGAASRAFASMTAGQPGWLTAPARALAALTAGHGLAVSLLLAAACAVTGLAIFADRLVRPALVLAAVLGLVFWVAEGFGGIATGQGTDPNTGPLLILLAALLLATPPRRAWPGPRGRAIALRASGRGNQPDGVSRAAHRSWCAGAGAWCAGAGRVCGHRRARAAVRGPAGPRTADPTGGGAPGAGRHARAVGLPRAFHGEHRTKPGRGGDDAAAAGGHAGDPRRPGRARRGVHQCP